MAKQAKHSAQEWCEQEIARILKSEYHPGDKALRELRTGCKDPEEILTILLLSRDRDLDTMVLENPRRTKIN